MEIKKRSGDIAKFDVGKIGAAMRKAFAATGVAVEESRMDELSLSVRQQLESTPMVTVEQVQDCVRFFEWRLPWSNREVCVIRACFFLCKPE